MYHHLFDEMLTQLEQVGASITRNETDPILTPGELNLRAEQAQMVFPAWVLELYGQKNGWFQHWHLERAGVRLSGFVYLFSFEKMYLYSHQSQALWENWYEAEDIERIQQHRILEQIHGDDAYITVKFLPKQQYELYYVGEGYVNDGGSADLPQIPLTLEQYLKVVTGCFGLYGIRRHLHNPAFYEQPFEVFPKLRLLQQLFPDFEPPRI